MEGGKFEKDHWATERICDRRGKAVEQSWEGEEKDGAENVYTPYRDGADVLQCKGADKVVTLGRVRVGNLNGRTTYPQNAENGSWRR